VLLAIRSEKSTIENKQDILFSLKIQETYFVSIEICQHKIRGGIV